MAFVLKLILLGENCESWELLESRWNPTSSSYQMIFYDLVVHFSGDFIHVWVSSRMVSSIAIFKKRRLLTQFLCEIFLHFPFVVILLLNPFISVPVFKITYAAWISFLS